MRAQAQRMNAIIADLLELSRWSPPTARRRASRSMCRACSSACIAMRSRAAIGRARCCSTGIGQRLYGAEHEIESAFTNLLVNGLKYTPADGTVRMRWWTDDDGAYFSVIDSGIGIPPSTSRGSPSASIASMPALARSRRLRARPRDRQARLAAAWRLARRAEHRGQGQHLHLPFPAQRVCPRQRVAALRARARAYDHKYRSAVDGRGNRM
jgi:hypothetical protein